MKDSAEIAGILKDIAAKSGAAAVGFSQAEPVEKEEWTLFCKWLREERNAGMQYMHNYPDIRKDPRLLLPGAKTIASLAFNFNIPADKITHVRGIASYALFEDYHKSLRKNLSSLLKQYFPKNGDINWRICIDSAPVLERYWAKKSGIGFQADNGMITIPGIGSRIFLAEIILDAEISEDDRNPWFAHNIENIPMDCGHCGACSKSCPGNALTKSVNCNRCISYLTIEHHGDWDETGKEVMETPEGKMSIFGCERCLSICPWNKSYFEHSPALKLNKNLANLSKEELFSISENEFITKFAQSPISRTGWEGWRRNCNL